MLYRILLHHLLDRPMIAWKGRIGNKLILKNNTPVGIINYLIRNTSERPSPVAHKPLNVYILSQKHGLPCTSTMEVYIKSFLGLQNHQLRNL